MEKRQIGIVKRVVVLALLALSARAENTRPAPASAYAPGRIFERSDGWTITSPTGTWFVPKRHLQDVPAKVAAVTALFPGGIPVRQTWGWTITDAGQRVEVFEEGSSFVVSTAKGDIYVHQSGDCFKLSPGQPGVRRLTPIEAITISREQKEVRRKQKRKMSTP